MTILGSIRRVLNMGLGQVGLEIRPAHDWENPEEFLPFKATLKAARDAGQSVSDFVEERYNRLGATQETVDQMSDLGVFDGDVKRVCEIGPGTGRYLERTVQICQPEHYEIYETAKDWAKWLSQTYDVVLRETDGISLDSTADRSIDLVQAHKVFVATPSLTTCSYLCEMARVVKRGGYIVFDILSEDCLDGPTLKAWLNSSARYGWYPALVPKQYVVDLLLRYSCNLQGSFFVDMSPGRTECMVFKCTAP